MIFTETYQICVILKSEVKICDPPSIAEYEDIPFLLKTRRLGPLEHLPLVEDLEGVHAISVLQLDDADLAERAAADDFQDLEVVFAKSEGLHAIGHRFDWKRKENWNEQWVLLYILIKQKETTN